MSGEINQSGMCTNIRSLGVAETEEGRNKGQDSNIERVNLQLAGTLENRTHVGRENGHVLNIDEWATSLRRILQNVPQYMCTPGHPGRISRIPETLREVDTKSYEPYIVSFGPYHHDKPRVKRMEKNKQVILRCVLEQKPEITLKDYLKEIKSIEPEVRSFYADIEMESGKFVQMLLLDSMYLITAFCGIADIETSVGNEDTEQMFQMNEDIENVEDNDNTQITTRQDQSNNEISGGNVSDRPRWAWILLAHDLFLLENQLPLFLLQKIHNLVYGRSGKQLIPTLIHEFGNLLSPYTTINSEMVLSSSENVHHLLHLCHMFFRPTLQNQFNTCPHPESSQMFRLGSAMQLYQAGVSFELRSGSSQNTLLDIAFDSSGKMVMPCLHVEDNTVSLIRNLIALEQMKYPSMGLDVSAYAVLLLHLVTIPDDVKLLRRKGIIQHHLASDKEMVYLVNNLSVGLSFDYLEDKYNLKPVFQELKRYSERRVPKWSAGLKHRYFNNPWTTISLLTASFLLLLTIIQTYYVIYSYYHPFFVSHN